MYNATHEGGPRNGVMTAVDDFVALHDRPIRQLVIPIYFGLAILADEDRLAANPHCPTCWIASRRTPTATSCWSWPRRPGSMRW